MKTAKQLLFSGLLAVGVYFLNSCQDDSVEPETDILFSMTTQGNQVTFTNQTAGASAYRWDFGDGSSSTEPSPTHVYPGKGKYVATLFVTTTNGKIAEGSTVIRIDKTTPVKLNDNTLADWDAVAQTVTSGPGGGAFRKAKFDYDSEYIYFNLEMTGTQASGPIFDFYVDSDNDGNTGLLTTGHFPGGGFDVLVEGAMLNEWFDVFYHKGAQTAFSFEPQTISEFYQIGTVEEQNGILKFEGRLVRSKIKGLSGKAIKLGIAATKNDWSAELGTLPDKGTPPVVINLDE